MTHSESIREIDVLHNGARHVARYFVQDSILHLSIGAVTWRSPAGPGDNAGMARALLLEELLRQDWTRDKKTDPHPPVDRATSGFFSKRNAS